MNELQNKVLDLFIIFKDICEKLDLKYYLVCGSALGTKRHQGFIPWDDDFDVAMLRDDYNKFMELAPSLLPNEIFLQNYQSDPQYPYVFAKLRNSNTTFIQKLLTDFDINHGIFMDIFPLDGYPQKITEQKKLFLLKKHYLRQLRCAFPKNENSGFVAKCARSIHRFLGYHNRTANTLKKYEKLISSYPIKNSKIICNHGTWYGKRDFINADFYGTGREAVFEGVPVVIPEKCEEYLENLYGDWKKLPPIEKRVPSHFCDIIDTKKSYLDYTDKRNIR